MPIVGGLDIHRRQITFDYLDTETGQVCRGQISPADREHLRAWLARFNGREDVAFAVEGCAGWRYVAEELAAAGATAHLAEPADTAFARGRKRHAKTDKTDARHLRMLLAEGRLPECWIPPARILECRALLELYNDLRRERTAWAQRIHAVLFHQGAPQLGEGALRTEKGVAGLRAAAAGCLSPAGQLQVATALEVIDALEARLHVVRHQLLDAARHLAGAKALADRLYGVGPVTALAMTCWLGGAGRFSSSRQAVRFAGPGHHRVLPRPQGPARDAVPAGAAGAPLGRLRGSQDPRPHLGPRPPLLRRGQGPQEQQARLPVRGPQDPPAGPSHPGRARRRRARRRLTHPPW
jgi:Transposase